jgi:predicted GNAT superfamily acetyltransferase
VQAIKSGVALPLATALQRIMGAETKSSSIVIRDVEGAAEMRALEQLQKEVWGLPDLDVVPFSHLVAAKEAGGVLVGAFDGPTMIGFIYGFASYENGQMAHHSHMLAVKPAYRNRNLGYQLKLAQRERVRTQGANFMTWTFDPLQSMNAYFNFRKLGVVADRYLIDFYGDDAASFLHRNGTDRLWVTWPLTNSAPRDLNAEIPNVLPLIKVGLDDSPTCNSLDDGLSSDRALIEIPADINDLQQRNKNLALVWRDATRWAFTKAIEADYLVMDFVRQTRGDQQIGVYLLSRERKLSDYV